MLKPVYSARTDPGRRRTSNQDAVYAGSIAPTVPGASAEPLLLVVADGVGGRERGQWASRTAVSVLVAELPPLLQGHQPKQALAEAVQRANAVIWREEGAGADSGRGAATTVVVALVQAGRLWWAHVGDSRAYLLRGGEGRRITRDHSWVADQVAAGQLTAEQARHSSRRNVITRGVGVAQEVQVDVGEPVELRPDDVVLLCSDGLHGPVSDDEISAIAAATSPDKATTRLINLSNERGGPDNISVVVCRLQSQPDGAGDDAADIVENAESELERTVVDLLPLRPAVR